MRKSKLERASPTKDRAYASVDTPIDADLETFTSTSSTVAAARKDSSPVKVSHDGL